MSVHYAMKGASDVLLHNICLSRVVLHGDVITHQDIIVSCVAGRWMAPHTM